MANVVGPQLDYNLPLEKRWLTLLNPPDLVATDIAIRGLILVFHKLPRLQKRAFPPAHLTVQSESSILTLTPFVEDWLNRGIITNQNIPTQVFWSRIFHVPKKDGRRRPVLDLSYLNLFLKTPNLKMEHLGKIL